MVNLEQLRKEIKALNPRKKLFRILKEELQVLGRWRNKPRGNPGKGFDVYLKNKANKEKNVG